MAALRGTVAIDVVDRLIPVNGNKALTAVEITNRDEGVE